MQGLTASELASVLRVHRSRISQLVSDGRLDGCYYGDGRERRFNAEAAAQALNRRLDGAQSLGNGSAARHARETILAASTQPARPASPAEPSDDHTARLAAAKAEQAEIAARRARREEALSEGRYLLADEVHRAQRAATARLLDAAERHHIDQLRAIAEAGGLDTRATLADARAAWRAFRARFSADIATAAETATHTDAEQAELDTAA